MLEFAENVLFCLKTWLDFVWTGLSSEWSCVVVPVHHCDQHGSFPAPYIYIYIYTCTAFLQDSPLLLSAASGMWIKEGSPPLLHMIVVLISSLYICFPQSQCVCLCLTLSLLLHRTAGIKASWSSGLSLPLRSCPLLLLLPPDALLPFLKEKSCSELGALIW